MALAGNGGAMLDQVFGYFRGRPEGRRLALYILTPGIRERWAQRLGLDAARMEAAGEIPPGWLGAGGGGAAAGGDGGYEASAVEPGAEIGPTVMAPRMAAANGAGMAPRAYGPTASGSAPRPVAGFAAGRPAAGTAPTPSGKMLEDVRAWKYQDPMRACMALDGSRVAQACWRSAIGRDRQAVMDELGALVETDGRWQALRNPASVLMASLRRRGLLG
ncbi:MAG: hypothetical protein PHR35_15710 [Kiritimatiellae bacterium]|nr:hypothetical protein [Kiritimatiellia bacterium]